MVGGDTWLVVFDVYFVGTILRIHHLRVLLRTAVGVGQHTIAFYFKYRRHKYMVYAAGSEAVRMKSVEGTVQRVA